ncbi:MAG: DNA methyltransferase [Armatimonadia bacterium]
MPRGKPNNKLNDLTNRDWMVETKSFWHSRGGPQTGLTLEDLEALTACLSDRLGEDRAAELLGQIIPSSMLSQAPPRGKLKSLHPATFSERDIERLIRFFTKEGELVLDPFLGSGSTLVAARDTGRRGLGIELIEQWASVARERLGLGDDVDGSIVGGLSRARSEADLTILQGDAREGLATLAPGTADFIVTSPPYWSILEKRGMKVQAEREAHDLPTKYSESAADLGNIEDYDQFLDALAAIFAECARVLKPKKYLAVVVSDFRHGPQFVLFHADLARRIEQIGLPLRGITILLQDNKNLYPFGVGNAFVSNIHHQYILIHQKPA